jgi:hypothetical protein
MLRPSQRANVAIPGTSRGVCHMEHQSCIPGQFAAGGRVASKTREGETLLYSIWILEACHEPM